MTDIIAFISARLDERQAAAEAAQEVDPGPWTVRALPPEWPRMVSEAGSHSGHAAAVVVAADGGELWDTYDSDYGDAQHAMAVPTAQHVVLHDPAHVLAEVKAKRALVEDWRTYAEQHRRDDFDPAAASAWVTMNYILVTLAGVHRDHPDYAGDGVDNWTWPDDDPAWRVDA